MTTSPQDPRPEAAARVLAPDEDYGTQPDAPAPRAPRAERAASGRVPPQSLEAERSVLASMMLDPEAVNTVVQLLRPEDFYRPAHTAICGAVISLYEKGEAVDTLTLSEELARTGQLEKAGGRVHLAELLDSVSSAANVEFHARIVLEKSILRRLIRASGKIAEDAYTASEDVSAILDRSEREMFAISESGMKQGFVRLGEILQDSFEAIQELYDNKQVVTGVPAGFQDLDMLTSGFQKSEFVVIAARPSMGKTALTLNIAQHMTLEKKLPVAFFSLEMSKESLVQRLLSAEARVDGHRLRTGFLRENEWPALTTAAGRLAEAPLFIDDSAGITALEVRAKARRLMSETNGQLAAVVIDYMQLLHGHGRQENRQQEISTISRSLKALAKELRIPVIALSQLKRSTDVREGVRRPMLSDLRESGAIEQDADVVIFIHRPEVYNQTPENEGIAEIIVGKQRNGPIGTVTLAFRKQFTRFENLSKGRE
ncbi:MAG: replicative DNA helicase [Gemmatimonadota bacterium]|jgi:replicative DNA helicase|nr:replicative DNA helicase [Gemmatimonadota bacterium]MDP6528617.1 replicative DNA helicase [Gemmatimonadota bacterium]MDP6803292.1 replicative DNA helicase [Gemmatimonadota bacterium]MDP7032229.1 replicative DNA helicase [Gemmatimonadota bacterium]